MMEDDRLTELTHTIDVVLDEDLASLQKMPADVRIERYNEIKSNEQEFLWEYAKEADLTDAERDTLRSKFRLARLLLAASFYDEGELPRAMADDFIEAELQAVVDFDRYRRFDVLDEDEIESKIRRMEGEVYELVTEYTSTQIANMDELMDNPDVQQDVMRRLLDRYQQRRDKIRQGFFVYVETHGLEHMVESIEDAVEAVDGAARERESVREDFREELQQLRATVPDDLRNRAQSTEAELQALAQQARNQGLSPEAVKEELDRLDAEELTEAQANAVAELSDRIDRTGQLEGRLDDRIDELESVKAEMDDRPREAASEEAVSLVEDELAELREERQQLREEVERLEAEREGIDAARDRLEQRQDELESQVSQVQESLSGGNDGLPENAVGTSMARLLELDYVGRVDTSIHETGELLTPDGWQEIPDGYWEGRSERRNERTRLDRLLSDADEEPERYPLNRQVRYEVTGSRLLGLGSSREMVVEAAVLTNLDAYVQNGFDAAPADLDQLLSLVNEAVSEAEQGDYHYLLGAASPTGWTDRVYRQLDDDEIARVRYSRNLSLVLVDLGEGEVVYDESDDIAARNSQLFEIPVPGERIDECVRVIRRDYVEEAGVDQVFLEDVVEAGHDVRAAKAAFDQLAEEGVGEQFQFDDGGLALAFE